MQLIEWMLLVKNLFISLCNKFITQNLLLIESYVKNYPMNNTVKIFEQFDVEINFEKIVLSTCFYFKFVKLKT